MKSYEEIVAACNAKIPRDVIAQREGSAGRKLNYLEGFYVIDRLNEVFGQGNWAYNSDVQLLHSGTVATRSGDTFSVHYSARVRLVVQIGDKPTEFTDYGYGDGTDKVNPGKAHELAIKEAVTDGLKRAARCLGCSFGNGLYDKSGDGIEDRPAAKPEASSPVQGQVPPKPKRETLNKVISELSQTIVKRNVKTLDELVAMVRAFGVQKKEDLTYEQAEKLLEQLKEVGK